MSMGPNQPCPVCAYLAHVLRSQEPTFVECNNCGRYHISGSALQELTTNSSWSGIRPVLSYSIRQRQNTTIPKITTEYVDNLVANSATLPALPDQADNLIHWLGRQTAPGEKVSIEARTHQAVVGAHTSAGVGFILEYLETEGLIKGSFSLNYAAGSIELTFDGWQRYSAIERGAATSTREAFMAMQFGDEELEHVYTSCFRVAVARAGFNLTTVQDSQPAGLIDDHIRVGIRRARFVIADLTHDNAGSYWEAGFAEGLEKPVIYTCKRSKFDTHGVHFDTEHLKAVLWDTGSLDVAASDLADTIRATFPIDAKMDG